MNQTELFFPEPPTPVPRTAAQQPVPEVDEPLLLDDAEPARQAAYTVRLTDYPHPEADIVKVAKQRFRRELDRQLGDDVVPALRAYQNVTESSESDLTRDEVVLATRWAKGYALAITAGFRDLGDTDEAYFDVRPI